jgi:hypothetical protein
MAVDAVAAAEAVAAEAETNLPPTQVILRFFRLAQHLAFFQTTTPYELCTK